MLRAISRTRWWLLLAVALVALTAMPSTISAHPLGNFSINLYSRLVVDLDKITVRYIVDQAEIPTFQEFGGAPPSPAAQANYLAQKAVELRQGLRLLVDQQQPELRLVSQALSFPAGQGGLVTTRIELLFEAHLPQGKSGEQRQIMYEDTNYAARQGWHEIVLQSGEGIGVLQSDIPTSDLSNELRAYPEDMLSSPLDVRSARVLAAPGVSTGTTPRTSKYATSTQGTDQFAALIQLDKLSPFALLAALFAAVGLGAVHALSPGHGKTVVGAYLIGARGTARHALFLGLTVTTTHTLGVFALGLITLYASQYILPEELYPALSILSGLIVVSMGLSLLRQRIRSARRGRMPENSAHSHDHEHHQHEQHHHADHEHTHRHDQHGHTHHHDQHEHAHHHHDDHEHGLAHSHGGHTHTHLPPGADGTPITWRSLLALGISGGLLPCPSALVVMLSAISLGRVGFGLLLIVAFSLGLAGVLTGIGILFVHGGRWFTRLTAGRQLPRLESGLRIVPVLSALVVTTAGIAITAQAVVTAGLWR